MRCIDIDIHVGATICTDQSIQQVYSEAQGYMKYVNDVSTLVVPIAHPVMANDTDRQLELKPWF